MNQRLQDVLMCPICIEMLRRPVVTLPCQHNLCRSCLDDLCRTPALLHRCPTCRKEIVFGPKGAEGLPRNLLVEQLLDEHEKAEIRKTGPPAYAPPAYTSLFEEKESVVSTSGAAPSADLVVRFKKLPDGVTSQAPIPLKQPKPPRPGPPSTLSSPKAIVTPKPAPYDPRAAKEMEKRLVAGYKTLQSKIDAVTKLIRAERFSDAATKSDEVASLAIDLPLLEQDCAKATKDVRDLAKALALKDQHLAAISLLFAASKLCERIPNPDAKVDELMCCAEAMQPVAKGMNELQVVAQFKQHAVPVLNDVWRKLTRVANADKDSKAVKGAWCLKHIAMCYSCIGDDEQSLERNQEAIGCLIDQFGPSANRHRIFGVCYHNLATCCKHLGRFGEAEKNYLVAIESYNAATDWANEDRKRTSVRLSANALGEVSKLVDGQ